MKQNAFTYDMDVLLNAPGSLCHPDFIADDESTKRFLRESCRVLIVGAGALGCEILSTLVWSGLTNLDIIDMDVIEVSNLNRQFLFRDEHVGKSKAQVAAEAIRDRRPACRVTWHHADVTKMPPDFFRSFHVVVSGLDSVEARRWLNATMVGLVQFEEDGVTPDASTVRPLVDGGTEGLAGQVRVIIPRKTACFECTLPLFPDQVTSYPLCTLASTPRQPEHCIEYASIVLWPQAQMSDAPVPDGDNPEHVQWVYERALDRAESFGIQGVTYRLTMGVLKRVIPAVASTNALIGSACALEVLKLATYLAIPLNDWMSVHGSRAMYVHTFCNERRADCAVCGCTGSIRITLHRKATMRELVEAVAEHPELRSKAPCILFENRPLFMSAPPALERATRCNLERRFLGAEGLVGDDGNAEPLEISISLSDASVPNGRQLTLVFPGDFDQPAIS